MYLHQTNGLKLQPNKIYFFRSSIKIIAYVAAILVPMTFPLSCLKNVQKYCFLIRIQLNPLESL